MGWGARRGLVGAVVDVVQALVRGDPPDAARGWVLRRKRAHRAGLHEVHMVRRAVLAPVRHIVACVRVRSEGWCGMIHLCFRTGRTETMASDVLEVQCRCRAMT